MLKRKFNNGKSGPWLYRDKQIDTYTLVRWLVSRNRRTGVSIHLSKLTVDIADEFLQQHPEALKEIN